MSFLRSCTSVAFAVAFLTACGGGLNPSMNGTSAVSSSAHITRVARAASGYKQLYAFQGHPDGASPFGGLVEMNGTLYGTTLNGSKNYCSQSCGSNSCYLGCGTIFTIDSAGSESVIYNFDGTFNGGADGTWPFVGLTPFSGALYGTTSGGGSRDGGTVFTTTASGNESVVYSFTGYGGSTRDGSDPEAVLTPSPVRSTERRSMVAERDAAAADAARSIQLTRAEKNRSSIVFKAAKMVTVSLRPSLFCTRNSTAQPWKAAVPAAAVSGCGTIFELPLHGKERVLYRFGGTSDGAYPNGLIAVHGVLYGTTEGGGSRSSGTFFSVTPSGKLTTLYNFLDIPDGNLPGASLIYAKGKFYGTTVGGGTAGDGTVFKIGRKDR